MKKLSREYIEEILFNDDELFNRVAKKRGASQTETQTHKRMKKEIEGKNKSSNAKVVSEVDAVRSPSSTTIYTKLHRSEEGSGSDTDQQKLGDHDQTSEHDENISDDDSGTGFKCIIRD